MNFHGRDARATQTSRSCRSFSICLGKISMRVNSSFALALLLSVFTWGAAQERQLPGMKMPAPSPSPSPAASPPTHSRAPAPGASPSPSGQMPGMQMPAPSPAASPSNTSGQMPGMKMPASEGDMGSLLVISDDGMGIRIGSEVGNVMRLGQMGSGTSWQPDSSPMYMIDKMSGKWL